MVPLLTYIQDIDVPVWQSQQKNAHFCARAIFVKKLKITNSIQQKRFLRLHRQPDKKLCRFFRRTESFDHRVGF